MDFTKKQLFLSPSYSFFYAVIAVGYGKEYFKVPKYAFFGTFSMEKREKKA